MLVSILHQPKRVNTELTWGHVDAIPTKSECVVSIDHEWYIREAYVDIKLIPT